jgi:hypothetical protein
MIHLPSGNARPRRRSRFLPDWLPDAWYNSLLHLAVLRRWPNLRRPQTLNEKLLWLKTFYDHPLLGECSDKVTVRDYLARTVGADVATPLIGIYDSCDAIPFDTLPAEYVIKASHGSGWNLFVTADQPRSRDGICRIVNGWLQDDYSRYARERHYRGLTPRIVVEPLLRSEHGRPPDDIKIDCMNGEPRMIMLHIDRFADYRQILLTPDWQPMPIRWRYPWPDQLPPAPPHLTAILQLARTLAAPFPYVRIDGYLLNDSFHVGELTFMPDRGVRMLKPADDLLLGQWLTLPGAGTSAPTH